MEAASGIVYVIVILLPDFLQAGPSDEDTMTTAETIAHSCATTTVSLSSQM
jgi:hypothetical protein